MITYGLGTYAGVVTVITGDISEVWDTTLADHQIIGSTGKALSDAGSVGNPWSTPLSGNNTAGTFGGFVQKLLTISKFLGLK